MRIEAVLEKKKTGILEDWFEAVIAIYAKDTASFLKSQKDPFSNPVGSNLLSGLTSLLEHLIHPRDNDDTNEFLDKIVRVRAVQTMFSPSQAVQFIFELKPIIRKSLEKELNSEDGLKTLLPLEDKIDRLAMKAFDLFAACREKIYEIKSNQERSKVFKAFERAGLIAGIPDA